jgi:hypothetical protein
MVGPKKTLLASIAAAVWLGALLLCPADGRAGAASTAHREQGVTLDRAADGPEPFVALYANLVSAILWGQSVSVELGKRWSGLLRVRSLNAGFLIHKAFAPEDKPRFSLGIGLAGRYYFRRNGESLRGYHLGVALEYHLFRAARPAYDWAAGALIPAVETGYRWIIRDRLLIGLGCAFGWGVTVHYTADYWFGLSTHENRSGDNISGWFANGNLDVGAVF